MIDTNLITIVALLLFVLGLFYLAHKNPQRMDYSEHPLYDAKVAKELTESAKGKFDKAAYKDALRDVDEALQLEPKNLYLLWLRSSIHNQLGNWHLAIEDCEHILSINHIYHWAYEQRGIAYFYLNQNANAKADFEQVIILEKSTFRPYFYLFIIASQEKNEKLAQSYLKQIFSLPFDKWDGIKAFLQLLYKTKSYSMVISFVDEAISRKLIAEEDFLFYRAWSHYYLKDYSQALADAERMLVLNPENDVALRVKGYTYKATKDYEKASEAFQAFHEKKPDKLWIHYEYALCLWFLERYSDAIPIARKLQEQKSDEAAFVNLEGMVHSGLSNFEAAIEAYSKSIILNPEESAYYNNRSGAYRHLKQLDKAWEDAQKAFNLKPDSVQGYLNRASLFLVEQNSEAALENVKKALELDESEAFVYATRAQIYIFENDFDSALLDIQKARELAHDRVNEFYALEALIEAARNNSERAQSLWKTAAKKEEKHWDEAWVILAYDLPQKLIPFAQAFIKTR